MSHYFTNDKNLKENRKEISFRFFGVSYTLITDAGVFSKNELDYGTYLLLQNVCSNNISGKVLDLGCGYGPVGIVIKSVFDDVEVTMLDINERAVNLALENVNKYKMNNRVLCSNSYNQVQNERFNHIVLNPPIRAGKKVIYAMFEDALRYLEDNGCLWIVMRKSHGAMSAIAKITEIFGNCETIGKEKGFFVLKAVKTH